MTEFLQFVLLGVGIGGAYALLAQGLVLVYRGSGVLNFGQAAMGMCGGFLYWQLQGGISGGGLPHVTAFVIAVLASIVGGVVIDALIMRPLRSASSMVRVVATLGVLVALESLATIVWGPTPVVLSPMLPTGLIQFAGLGIGQDQLIIFCIGVAVTVVLWLGDRFTTLGIALRANAESQDAAAALGWSSNVLSSLAWGLGAGFATTSVILVGSFSGLQVSDTSLLIFPMLAAALLSGFRSFPLVLVGSVLVGVGQSLVAGFVTTPGAGDAFPLLLVIVLVVLRGRGVTVRGGRAARMPSLGTGRIPVRTVFTILIVFGVLIFTAFSDSLNVSIAISLGWATILLSVVVLLGFAGQLSFEQVAMAGLSALIAGRLAHAGVPFLLAFLIAVVASVPIGLVFALPALRTSGINLAIVTLGLGVTVWALLFQNTGIIGSQVGTPVVGTQRLFGYSIDPIGHSDRYTLFVLAVFAICGIAVANVRRGSAGRQLVAVRTNERAAAAMGINVFAAKLYAFGLGASMAAIGGVVLGFSNGTIVYDQFSPFESALAVAYAVVGGVGFVIGALFAAPLIPGGIGTFIVTGFWSTGANYFAVAGGILLILNLIADPNGLASANAKLFFKIKTRLMALVSRDGPRTTKGDRCTTVAVSEEGSLAPWRHPRTLSIDSLTVRYGGVTALDNVSLSVRPGRIVGLIGPNGSGKTTLIDAVSGFANVESGSVRLNDINIRRWSVHRRSRNGLGRSFQSLELFDSSTVAENLAVGTDTKVFPSGLRDVIRPRSLRMSRPASEAAREFGLLDLLDSRVDTLPLGHRHLVAIARSVALNPSVLLLDEPVAGLALTERVQLAELIRKLARDWGIAVLVVEHDMDFVMGLCDELVVLDFGRVIASGAPADVRAKPEVIAAYLGTTSESADEAAPQAGTAALVRQYPPAKPGAN